MWRVNSGEAQCSKCRFRSIAKRLDPPNPIAAYAGRMRFLALILTFFSGALTTLQTGSNTELKKSLNQPLYALIVNYFVGVAAVVIDTAVRCVQMPSISQAVAAPWWAWLGGILGAGYG